VKISANLTYICGLHSSNIDSEAPYPD